MYYVAYDLDSYVRSRFTVANADGGMGYDVGVRRFDCPLCGESRGRAWLNVARGTAGCWNGGCPLHEHPMGALDFVAAVEGLGSRGHALRFMMEHFPLRNGIVLAPPRRAPEQDWCRPPAEMLLLSQLAGSVILADLEAFCARQWSLPSAQIARWIVGVCIKGRYAQRAIIPIILRGNTVAFQARTLSNGEPKYLTSRAGAPDDPQAECGRSTDALLFNLDAVPRGGDVLLVEGVGDVFDWEARADRGTRVAVAMFGLTLTEEKLALLCDRAPSRVTVAVDASESPDETHAILRVLRAWGFPVEHGVWVGAKDAGEGARLEIQPPGMRRVRA